MRADGDDEDDRPHGSPDRARQVRTDRHGERRSDGGVARWEAGAARIAAEHDLGEDGRRAAVAHESFEQLGAEPGEAAAQQEVARYPMFSHEEGDGDDDADETDIARLHHDRQGRLDQRREIVDESEEVAFEYRHAGSQRNDRCDRKPGRTRNQPEQVGRVTMRHAPLQGGPRIAAEPVQRVGHRADGRRVVSDAA